MAPLEPGHPHQRGRAHHTAGFQRSHKAPKYTTVKTRRGFEFLRSGSNFWLLSPNNRNTNGNANGFNLNAGGNLNNNNVTNANGVRPALSSKNKTATGLELRLREFSSKISLVLSERMTRRQTRRLILAQSEVVTCLKARLHGENEDWTK